MSIATVSHGDQIFRGEFVYMLICRDGRGPAYIKFGHTCNVHLRLYQLRTGCPIPPKIWAFIECPSREKAIILERDLHKRFKVHRTTGEWFRFDLDDPEEKKHFNAEYTAAFEDHLPPYYFRPWTQVNVEELDRHQSMARAIAAQAVEERKRMWAEINSDIRGTKDGAANRMETDQMGEL